MFSNLEFLCSHNIFFIFRNMFSYCICKQSAIFEQAFCQFQQALCNFCPLAFQLVVCSSWPLFIFVLALNYYFEPFRFQFVFCFILLQKLCFKLLGKFQQIFSPQHVAFLQKRTQTYFFFCNNGLTKDQNFTNFFLNTFFTYNKH